MKKLDYPAPEPAALVAFALVDGLLRTLVSKKVITTGDAVAMLDNLVTLFRDDTLVSAREVAGALEKMLHEYRK